MRVRMKQSWLQVFLWQSVMTQSKIPFAKHLLNCLYVRSHEAHLLQEYTVLNWLCTSSL